MKSSRKPIQKFRASGFVSATSLQELGQLDRALAVYQKPLAAGAPAALRGVFDCHSPFAQKKELDKAFEHLNKALQAGYNKPEQLSSEPVFGIATFPMRAL